MNFDFKKAVKMIVKIRTAEEFIAKKFFEEKIFSFLHLTIGQEASAVGVASALEIDDIMLGNHRSHGHYLAKGGDLPKMIYEVFGDQRGCCGGYGGSMHMLDRDVGFNGSTPILGSIPPIAVGQSFSCKVKKLNNVTVAFLGDGAAEEGIFMESINLAANKKCNIIFVIEDNKYSVASKMLDRKSEDYDHKKLFEGLGAFYIRENGQNILNTYKAALNARKTALTGKPVVLHLDLIRRHGHSGPMKEIDHAEYRHNFETIEYRDKNDCLNIAKIEAQNNGYKLSEIESWINDEEYEVMKILNKVKDSIDVRQIN